MGSTTYEMEMSTLPTLLQSMALLYDMLDGMLVDHIIIVVIFKLH